MNKLDIVDAKKKKQKHRQKVIQVVGGGHTR